MNPTLAGFRLRSAVLVLFGCLAVAPGCSSPPGPGQNQFPTDLSASPSDAAADAGVCGTCPPEKPLCDFKAKMCVACRMDGDCPVSAVCKLGSCMPGCSQQHAGCGDAGSCDVDLGACHGCLADANCLDPMNPTCDLPSGRCGACSTMKDKCPDGSYCVVGGALPACAKGCKGDSECQTGDGGSAASACCNHVCVDTGTSLQSCGGCGMACNKSGCYGGKCLDLQGDTGNCGGCGKVCPVKNNLPVCMNGTCGTAGCAMGFGDCDNNPMNGCETSLASDKNNCGACGKLCSPQNAGGICLNSKCAILMCNPGFRDCNGSVSDGCEVNIQSDPLNCGTCGQNCGALPHATAGCMNAGCVIGACDPGFGNCNKNDGDGCEAPLSSDPVNCGTCGKVCPAPPNVITTCAMGACGSAGCNNGYADCDMNLANGCEVNTQTNPNNCGACNNSCPAYANALPGCAMGACGLGACKPGFSDCDGNPANGCELPTSSDKNNCGGCNVVCMGMCVNSMCINGPACSNGSFTDCNPQGTTLIANSAFVDPKPPQGWVQCAGFINTIGDDVAPTFLNNCLNTTRLYVRVYTQGGAIEEDNYALNMQSWNAWPNFNYLGGNPVFLTRTYWGTTTYFTSTDGRDACAQQAAPSGTAFGTGNGSVSVIVGGNIGYNEYRVSCGGMNLPDRKIAIYR